MADETVNVASETTSQPEQTQAVEATAPAAEQTQATETTEGQGSEPKKPLGDKGVDELIRTRRRAQEAEREAAYFRGIAEGRQPAQQQKPTHQGPPDVAQFENYDDFLVAKAKFELRQELSQSQAQAQQGELERQWNTRLAKAAEKYPDIREVINDPSIMISDAMARVIKESDHGPELARHLAMNPNEAARIAYLNPFAAAKELGRLEAQFSASGTPVNKISQAPEPMTNLKPSGSVGNFDYEKSSMDEFMNRRQKEAKR